MISFFEDLKEKRLKIKGQRLLVKYEFEKAYHIFQKAIIINNSVENQFNIAVSLLSLSEYSKAEIYLKLIFDNYPENELNLLSLAECYIMQKKWGDAIEFYQKAVHLSPDKKSYQVYLEIAQDVVAREKYVKAKELFSEASLELKLKNDQKALDILLHANEYLPNDATILNNIATLYIMLKDFPKAYSYSMKAVKLRPDDQRFQKNLSIAKKRIKKK